MNILPKSFSASPSQYWDILRQSYPPPSPTLNFTSSTLLPIQNKIPALMFGLFKKDPIKQLEKEYRKLMEEAMRIQRSGDLRAYAVKIEAAEEIQKKIEELRGS